MKKSVKIAGAAVLSLCLCWFIGQQLKDIPGTEENVAQEGQSNPLFEHLIFEGVQDTTDNPWGKTAGLFEMEDMGACIFMTPNTGVVLEETAEVKNLELQYQLYPAVKESSDGAGIVVWVMDETDAILYETEWSVSAEDGWQDVSLALEDYDSAVKVKLLCNNGGNDDDSGDWVVVREKQEGLQSTEQGDMQEGKTESDFVLVSSNTLPSRNASYNIVDGSMGQPVLMQGNLWDSLDVLNPSVIRWNDKYYNYYSGWDGTTWRTGLAVSEDGVNWDKKDDAVLDVRKNQWDDTYIAANGSAIVYDNKVYYYYHGMNSNERCPAIGLAMSEDGENFEERLDAPVLLRGEAGSWDEAGVADPYVIEFNGNLYMYYLGMNSLGIQRLGVAVSEDGVHWIKHENNPIMDVGVAGAFDEGGLGEPSVIYCAPYFWMIYTGRNSIEQRNLGVAVSLDGINWKKLNYEGIIDLASQEWSSQVVCDTTLLAMEDGSINVWYGGGDVASPDENLNGKIGLFKMQFAELEDATQFEPNMDWNDCLVQSTDVLKGSYEIEGEDENRYAWVTDESSIMMKNNGEKNAIIIKGYVPMDLYQQIGNQSVTLSFFVNGICLGEKTFEDAEMFEVELEKPQEIESGDYFELRIVASAYVNAKENNLLEDERDISWMVFGITN